MRRKNRFGRFSINLFLALVVFVVAEAGAAVIYISPSGAGARSGSDWTNSVAGVPGNLQRGNTYYFAAGIYGSQTFNTAESGTLQIIIRKATLGNHGTETGWTSSLAGQAVFGPITVQTGYWVIDGQVRDATWRAGYGFKISGGAADCINLANYSASVASVTVRYVEMAGGGLYNTAATGTGVYSHASKTNHDITVQNCYTHDIWPDVFSFQGNNYLFEYNFVGPNASSPQFHGQSFADHNTNHIIVRNNFFENPEGTAVYTVISWGQNVRDLKIYGNVVYNTPTYTGSGISAFVEIIQNATVSDISVTNNTLYNVRWWPRIVHYDNAGTNRVAYNNIWYGCPNCTQVSNGNFLSDYNYFYAVSHLAEPHEQVCQSGCDIFANAASNDFHLKTPTAAGYSIPSPSDVDPDGNLRGSDGSWDRGAYEFGGRPAPPPVPTPTPPAGPTPTPTVPPSPTPTVGPTPTPRPTASPSSNESGEPRFETFKNVFNPLKEFLTIRYSVNADPVTVIIYDREGREVRKLDRIGGQSVWDGRDAEGRLASSGTYLVILKARGKTLTKKVVLIK